MIQATLCLWPQKAFAPRFAIGGSIEMEVNGGLRHGLKSVGQQQEEGAYGIRFGLIGIPLKLLDLSGRILPQTLRIGHAHGGNPLDSILCILLVVVVVVVGLVEGQLMVGCHVVLIALHGD